MERVTGDVEGGHLLVGDADAARVGARVQLAPDREAGLGGRRADQVHDDAAADQRLGPPVLADEGEQAVLDPVPLAGARRQVMDCDFDPKLIGA